MDVSADAVIVDNLIYLQKPKMTEILVTASLSSSLRNFRGPLIEALCDAGHQVHAAAPDLAADAPTRDWLEARGVACHDVPITRAGFGPVADLRALWALYRLMRHLRPDVFLGYTIKPVIWGLIAARAAGVPQRVALITGLGYAFTEGTGRVRGAVKALARGLYKIALRSATLVFFQNDDDRADFAKMGLLPPDTKVRVVAGSGIDLRHFPAQSLPERPVRFLLIARLLGDKGIREYAQAARIVRQDWPEVEFHLVGGTDPNPAGIPQNEVSAWHAAGDVFWHGAQADVRPFLAQCHVYVLPSYREGTPRTVLEAMATGRAVITTDAPGCRQTVAEDDTGFLVPVRDADALAAAMLRVVQTPDLIARFGAAARARAEARYDVRRVNADMLREMGLG
jgi:glycosyltransferase involved in cell wall biosynthesis